MLPIIAQLHVADCAIFSPYVTRSGLCCEEAGAVSQDTQPGSHVLYVASAGMRVLRQLKVVLVGPTVLWSACTAVPQALFSR